MQLRQPFLLSLKGARHVGTTGRRWSFLLTLEEVSDERGLGAASSGHTEDTHSASANSSRDSDSEKRNAPLLLLKMLGLLNVNGTNTTIKIPMLAEKNTVKL